MSSTSSLFGRTLRVSVAGMTLLALGACAEGEGQGLLKPKTDDGEVVSRASTGGSVRTTERDVEAPEVFQATEAGLWDGRPSLGGVWVAHPDVEEPERAIIRNEQNGKFVIGALFKRERQAPGPRLQVSSDAAAALGVLAGQPSNLNVVALRREGASDDAAPQPEAEDAAEAQPGAVPLAPEVSEGTLDPAESAAKAPDAPAPAPTTKPRAKPEAVAAAKPEAAARPEPTATPAAETVAEARTKIAETALKALDSEPQAIAAAATPAPRAEPVKTAAVQAPKPTPASRTQDLKKPYVQIGIFSVEQNARNTATSMRQSGMVPTVKSLNSQGKEFWRVVVGPVRTGDEMSHLLNTIKGAGFTDAYAVSD